MCVRARAGGAVGGCVELFNRHPWYMMFSQAVSQALFVVRGRAIDIDRKWKWVGRLGCLSVQDGGGEKLIVD